MAAFVRELFLWLMSQGYVASSSQMMAFSLLGISFEVVIFVKPSTWSTWGAPLLLQGPKNCKFGGDQIVDPNPNRHARKYPKRLRDCRHLSYTLANPIWVNIDDDIQLNLNNKMPATSAKSHIPIQIPVSATRSSHQTAQRIAATEFPVKFIPPQFSMWFYVKRVSCYSRIWYLTRISCKSASLFQL